MKKHPVTHCVSVSNANLLLQMMHVSKDMDSTGFPLAHHIVSHPPPSPPPSYPQVYKRVMRVGDGAGHKTSYMGQANM